jgi:putative spermidine/putrescine transport system permease protein
MFNALRDQIDPTIAAISTLMIAVTTLGLVLVQRYGRGEDEGRGRAAATRADS